MLVKLTNKTPTCNFLYGIPEGKEGVRVTLSLMSKLVRSFKKSQPIRNIAIQLTGALTQKNRRAEVSALFNFVKYEIRYVRDINGIETIQTPQKTLELKAGDCDDKATLLASLLESIGFRTRFIAVGFKPDNFVHVLVQVKLDESWLSLETTEPQPIGWFPPNVKAIMIEHN